MLIVDGGINLRGGGGGANGYFFVKLDFEIAVDQQTKTSDRIRPNLAKYPEHAPYPYFMCSSCS